MEAEGGEIMSALPIPAKTYFADFAFDLIDYDIIRNGKSIANAKGLKNKEHGRTFVSFLFGIDVSPGDILIGNGETLTVSEISIDTYNGEKQIVNAFYRP